MASNEGIDIYGIKIRDRRHVLLSPFARSLFMRRLGLSVFQVTSMSDEELVHRAEEDRQEKAEFKARNKRRLELMVGKHFPMQTDYGEMAVELNKKTINEIFYKNYGGNVQTLYDKDIENFDNLLANSSYIGWANYYHDPSLQQERNGIRKFINSFAYFKTKNCKRTPIYLHVAILDDGRAVFYCATNTLNPEIHLRK